MARRESLNLSGAAEDRIGDIVYFLKPTYTTWDGSRDANSIGELSPKRMTRKPITPTHVVAGHHTPHLPAARRGMFHNSARSLWFGAGLGAHGRLSAPIHLRDVAPTLAWLLGVPGPAAVPTGRCATACWEGTEFRDAPLLGPNSPVSRG